MRSRGKIVSIGIAPWGVVDHREDLIGSQVTETMNRFLFAVRFRISVFKQMDFFFFVADSQNVDRKLYRLLFVLSKFP